MQKQYFRTIQTQDPSPEAARVLHYQKLNNYLIYGDTFTDAQVKADQPLLSYSKEVCSQSTGTCSHNHNFIITTILCCEDDYDNDDKAI